MLSPIDIERYARESDFYLKTLEKHTEAMREVKKALDENRITQEIIYKNQINEIKHHLSVISNQLEKLGLFNIDKYEIEIDLIKNLLEKDWPIAIDQEYFEITKEARAESILDMIVMENLKGLRFLDYKCNSGHIAKEANDRGTSFSVGYDEDQSWEFNSSNNLFFTSNFDEVINKGPFDVILLYDVLDHIHNPEEVLNKLKQILSNKGRIYVRCHPWCSKHGGHLHEQINKAYLHLILNEDELVRLGGYKIKKTNKLFKPLEIYRKWFETNGYNIQSEVIIESEPDAFFFENTSIFNKLQNHWQNDFIRSYISIDFVDYILEFSNKGQKVF